MLCVLISPRLSAIPAMNDLRAPTGAADVAPLLDLVRSKFSANRASAAEQFVKTCGSSLGPAELAERSVAAWAALLSELFKFAAVRQPGQTLVRAFNPDRERDGWECGCSVIEVVTDDMPFLVNTIGMAVTGAKLQAHRLIHPVLNVGRNERGE